MKRIGLTIAGCFALLLTAHCGSSGLTNPIDVTTCNGLVQSAINSKCTGADAVILTCPALTKSTAKNFEKVDVTTCAANINAAADCTGAKAVTCAISYTE